MREKPEPGTEGGRVRDEEELDLGLEDPRVMAWFAEHIPQLRRSASGHRILYRTLAFGFVLGLVVHIGAYALRAASPGEPLALVADLLYALGYAMWTGVVVVLFVQVIPEVKKRQFQQAVAAYEAKVRDRGRPEGPQT